VSESVLERLLADTYPEVRAEGRCDYGACTAGAQYRIELTCECKFIPTETCGRHLPTALRIIAQERQGSHQNSATLLVTVLRPGRAT